MINVLIADDHEIFREGIKKVLGAVDDITVAGEADNGREVLIQVKEKKYDVVILDLNMPGMDGFDILKEIKKKQTQAAGIDIEHVS